jgi:hypothetical protein
VADDDDEFILTSASSLLGVTDIRTCGAVKVTTRWVQQT